MNVNVIHIRVFSCWLIEFKYANYLKNCLEHSKETKLVTPVPSLGDSQFRLLVLNYLLAAPFSLLVIAWMDNKYGHLALENDLLSFLGIVFI